MTTFESTMEKALMAYVKEKCKRTLPEIVEYFRTFDIYRLDHINEDYPELNIALLLEEIENKFYSRMADIHREGFFMACAMAIAQDEQKAADELLPLPY